MIETDRLRLRPFRPDDVDEVTRWVADPAFTRHLGGAWSRRRVVEMLERAGRHHAEHGYGPLAVEDRATGALVGRSGLAFHSAWPADPELGWWIAPERQGGGLATEAGAACLRHAFEALGLPRVVSIALEANAASRRVMEKLGFRLHERVPSEWGELLVHLHEAP
ncbi:MAG TPA: GNAT family N-acetyltransferase [Gaiellaceae bacterium]